MLNLDRFRTWFVLASGLWAKMHKAFQRGGIYGVVVTGWRRMNSRRRHPFSYYLFQFGCKPVQWHRVVMDRETEALVRELDPPPADALEISGSKWESFGFHSYRRVAYPEFDICEETLDQKFDLIIAEQVFEHLRWPRRAANNAYYMLRPGGCFLITTPFLIKIHEEPIDCTRWSEYGMRYFLADSGFPLKSITTGSWGNRQCVKANLRYGWQKYRAVFHRLTNEPHYPLSVWALARRN